MDKVTQVVSALTFSAAVVTIIWFLVAGLSEGGIFYGKYLKKSKRPHYCNHPVGGETGDQWQCRKCSRIWEYTKWSWEKQ